MAHHVEVTSETVRTANVQIAHTEYEAGVNRALRKLAERVKIQGFRKGKVPMNIMKQRYGQAVQSDVLDELLNKSIQTVVEEVKQVLYVDRPNITSLPINGGTELAFTIELEVRPTIDPIGYKGIEIERPSMAIGDEEINLELMAIRRQQGVSTDITDRDTIQEGDLVTFKFHALSDDEELAQFQGDDAEVRIGDSVAMPGIEEALKGAKFGSTVVAHVKTDDKFRVESLQNKEFDVEIEVKKVVAMELADLTDDLAKKVGMGETIEELKATIRKRLQSNMAHDARHHAEEDLIDRLLTQNTFAIPPRYLDQDLLQTVRQQLSRFQQFDEAVMNQFAQSMKETVRHDRERQIRSEFLLHAIAEKEGIKVENDDLTKTITHQAMHMNATPAQLMQHLNQNRDALFQMMNTARLEKTLTWLVDHATVKDISWETAEKKKEAREEARKLAAEKAMPSFGGQAAAAAEVEEDIVEASFGFDENAAREAYAAMTVNDLKDLCKNNDLKVGGKKEELIERLIEAKIQG